MEATQKIQTLKNFLTRNAFSYGWNTASKKDIADDAETIINLVAISSYGFASEIATTVEKFKRVSEKQAYWIAKAAVENEQDTRVSYIYEA